MSEENRLQFDDALLRLCDDALSADERDQLAEELRRSKTARESYIRYVSLHFWLTSRFRRLKPHDEAPTAEPGAEVAAHSTSLQQSLSRSWGWLLALAASVALLATTAWNLGLVGPRVAQQPAGYRKVAAMVYATHGCQWGHLSTANRRPGQVLRDGSLIDLWSGMLELHFDGGARVIVHGPATLEVTSGNSCDLQSGELVARVDGDADGFSVSTGALRVVDLGTEFGIRRSTDDIIQLEVFEGKVAVYDTSVLPMSAAARAVGTLRQGQTATASLRHGNVADTLQVGAELSGQFVRTLPSGGERFDPAATELVADGFSRVPDGRPLAGISSGFGWTSAWRTDTVEFLTAQVAGFAAHATNSNQGNTAVHRTLPWVLDDSRPVYASARFRIDGSDPVCTAWVLLFESTPEPGGGESNLMGFGISDRKFSARLASASEDLTVLPAAKWSGDFGQYVSGREHRLVARLEFDAVDDMERLAIWVDPGDGQVESAEPPTHVVTRNTGRSRIDTAAVRFWEMDGDTRGYVDDLRIGPTWQSVVE